jgi:hypothetical protein
MIKDRKVRVSVLGGLLEHVVAVPAGDRDKRDLLGVVADLLDEGGRLLDDLVETVLAPLDIESAYSNNDASSHDAPSSCPSC